MCPASLIFVTDATIRPSVTSANESWINSGLPFVGYGIDGEEAKDVHKIVPCPPNEVYRNCMTNITQLDSGFKVGLCIRVRYCFHLTLAFQGHTAPARQFT